MRNDRNNPEKGAGADIASEKPFGVPLSSQCSAACAGAISAKGPTADVLWALSIGYTGLEESKLISHQTRVAHLAQKFEDVTRLFFPEVCKMEMSKKESKKLLKGETRVKHSISSSRAFLCVLENSFFRRKVFPSKRHFFLGFSNYKKYYKQLKRVQRVPLGVSHRAFRL